MRLRSVAVAVLLWGCVPAMVRAQSGVFKAADQENVLGTPSGVAIGDFDRDGSFDVVVSSSDSGTASILVGFNDGTLLNIGSTAAGNVPSALVTGLFDDDSLLDLVVANLSAGAIVFLKGNGDASFQPPGAPTLGVGDGPVALAATDLNGDGELDVVAANEGATDLSPGTVALLRGNGDGTFTLQGSLDTELGTRGVAVGRIDNDTQVDVVAVNNGSNSFSPFFGRGNFSFDIGNAVTTGAAPKAIAVGNLNGDSSLDVVTADGNADAVSVFISNGDRTFRARAAFPVARDPDAIAIGDVNADGRADVVVGNYLSGDVSVLLGNGQGGLGLARTFVADQEPFRLMLGNFNDDNLPDIVTANSGGTVAILVNEGAGSFAAVEDLVAESGPGSVAAGDIDGDAFPDLVVGHDNSGAVVAFRSRPAGGFSPGEVIMERGRVVSVAAVDFNDDGVLDVAGVDRANQNIAVRLGTGGGAFAEMTQTFQVASEPAALTTGDFDDDGVVDLAVTSFGSDMVSVLLGRGDGTFNTRQDTTVGDSPLALGAADFNCDDVDDLLVANNVGENVSVLLSNQNGTFSVRPTINNVGMSPGALAIADFNRDGQPDFAVASLVVPPPQQGGRSVRVFIGGSQCNGTFTPVSSFGGELVSAVVARDFTGDQIVDIAAVNQTSNAVQIFQGMGNGQFGAQLPDNVSRMPVAITAADFGGDGRYDAATANNAPSANNLSVLTSMSQNSALRADGNGDSRVSAADVVTVLRELTDGDGQQVEGIGNEGPQTRAGVDANGDGRVNRQDISATATRLFL